LSTNPTKRVEFKVCYRVPKGDLRGHLEIFRVKERPFGAYSCKRLHCMGTVHSYLSIEDLDGGKVYDSSYCEEHGGLTYALTEVLNRFEVLAWME
jgi:hypothetical protein